MIKKSFTLRVLAVNFLLLALPLLIDSFLFFQDSYFESIREAKIELREIANFRAFSLAEIDPVKPVLLKAINYFLNLSAQIEPGAFNAKEASEKLATAFPPEENLQILIMTPERENEYKTIASNNPALVSTTFKSYLRLKEIERRGSGSFIRFIYEPTLGIYRPHIFLAYALYDSQKKPIGLVLAASEIGTELDLVLTTGGESKNIHFAVLSPDGIVLRSSLPALQGHYLDTISPERRKQIFETEQLGTLDLADQSLPVIKGNDPPYFEFVFNDQIQIAYRAFVPGLDVSILAFSSKQEYFASAIKHFLLVYITYGLILIIGGGITYWLALWISRPLRQLQDVMHEVSKGNLQKRFHEEPLGFEINLIGRIFNSTLDSVLENIKKTEDERVQKEIFQKEIDIGREAQKSLFPAVTPVITGAEVAAVYIPAQEVGADFYFYLSKKDRQERESFFFGVTDAAGKGISACLYAVFFRSLVITYATLYDDLSEILRKTNNDFIEVAGETGMFVKALSGIYHPDTKTVTYCSCGNVPGILRKKNGQLLTLNHGGVAIGIKEEDRFVPNTIQLDSGDLILFFTDGLLLATNEKHEYFTEKRLHMLLQQKRWETAAEAIAGLSEEIQNFTASLPQEDEIAIIAFKVIVDSN